MLPLKKLAISGVKWTGLATGIMTILQFVQLAVLARLLAPGDFGLMAMVMVVIGFAQTVADLGVSNAIIQRRENTRDQLSSLYWLNILAGTIIFALILLCSPVVVSFYDEPRLQSLLFWVALIFLITPPGQQFHVLLQKHLQFNRIAKIEILATALGTAITIISALCRQGIFSLIWGQLAGVSTNTILLMSIGLRTWRPQVRLRREDLKGYLAFGLYQMGDRSLSYLAVNMDNLLIGKLLGSEVLGFYAIAYQLMNRPKSLFNPIITRVAFPVFSVIQEDNTQLSRGYLKIIQIIALIQMPIYCGMFAVSQPLITLLLGPTWKPAIRVLQILVWLGMLYSLRNPISGLFLSKGRADVGFWMNVMDWLTYTTAILIGSHWGIYGVAWALVIVNAGVTSPVEFWFRWYLVQMKPLAFVNSFLPFFLLALFMAVCVITVDHYIQINNLLLRIGILVTLGGIIYGSGILYLKKPFVVELIALIAPDRK